MSGVLDGIRVIEWAAWHQGPEAGSMLGDLGADVIKIEDRVTGDPFRGAESLFGTSVSMGGGTSMAFEIVNRNKRSVTLDLKKERGKEVLYRLISKSDVFLTSYPLSVARKLGVDYESLVPHNPKLIYAIGSGLGIRGPDRDRRTFDIIAQGRSGIMFMISDRDHKEPYQIVGGVVDQLGAILLAYAVLAALLARDRKGIAQMVEVSLLGSALHLQRTNVGQFLLTNRVRARHSRTRAKNPLSNQYRCGDGKWIILAAFQSDRFWSQFCKAVEHPELADDIRFKNASERSNHSKELIALLDGIFAERSREKWLALLEERCKDLPFGPIFEISDLASDPQVLENEYIREVNHPSSGKIRVVGSPVFFSKTSASLDGAAPAFGQHTEETLLEICGYNWEEITELKEKEVI